MIELADSSLGKDRGVKRELYARYGVPEYWIVNLIDLVIEVHREPEGEQYRTVMTKARGQTISPVELPDIEIAVAQIL